VGSGVSRGTLTDSENWFELRRHGLAPSAPVIHTEEVTGSIPVSPTQLSGGLRVEPRPLVIFVQQQVQQEHWASQGSARARSASCVAAWRSARSRSAATQVSGRRRIASEISAT